MKNLQGEVRAAAVAAGYTTQGSMAAALDISASYAHDLMNGRRRFTPEMLQRAASTFKAPMKTERRWQCLGAREAGWKIGVVS